MAVKERKQITGTTAQINAYKGHEGQIVWDKEKKTLVGMSGTAGKNYPLAPKTYVDNEVAKVNTEVQKTNAEVAKKQPKGDYATNAKLTEGLAGKEDKGVCLPLSGGKLTGDLLMGSNARQIVFDDDGGEIYIGQSTPFNLGGSALILRTANDVRPNEAGTFILAAGSPDGQYEIFVGRANGDLSWQGQELERIAASDGKTYIRYSSGLQIVYIRTEASPTGVTKTFGVPFSSTPIAVATHLGTANHVVITADCSPTALVLRTNFSVPVDAYALIIGRWK